MPEERISRILAAAGVASRRGADALVTAGRVTVDGRPAVVGERVDPERSVVAVDGRPAGAPQAPVHLALHKPAGVTATVADRHAVRTVLDLVPPGLVPPGTRLYPVGRLDRESEGLLLLTNDGPWADRVMHPRHGVEREYAVAVGRPLPAAAVEALAAGIPLDEGLARALTVRPQVRSETARLAALLAPPPAPGLAWYRLILAQGWKRQVRRMLAAVGIPVLRLVRVRIGTVRLDGLETGSVRALSAAEVGRLVASATRGHGPRQQGPRPPVQRQRASRRRAPRPPAPLPPGQPV